MTENNFKLQRTLTLQENNKRTAIELVLGKTRQTSPNGPWECDTFLSVIMSKPTKIFGEDGLDAFLNSLLYCRGKISDEKKKGRDIWWIAPDDNAGIKIALDR